MRKSRSPLRRLDARGQLCLGKQLAGALVTVTVREPGVWEIRQVPADEEWLHTPAMAASLERAFAWALAHPPMASDFDTLLPPATDM